MGKVASEYTYKRLHGKFVDLGLEGPFRGRYGHLLAYVYVDGKNFNLELVSQGLSPYYTRYGHSEKYHDQFMAAERYARKNRLGIWGDPELTQKYLRLKSKWGPEALKIERAAPPAPTSKGGIVYRGNIKYREFHRPGCKYYDCKDCTRVFRNRNEAISAGFIPCKICRP